MTTGTRKKPTLSVDFDGVIHSYTSPWVDEKTIPDPPVPGALRWLWKATEWFNVVVYSSRSKSEAGRRAMFQWMMEQSRKEFDEEHPMCWTPKSPNTSYPIDFVHEKPSAFLTIDDRAICFEGDWTELEPADLLGFKPWNRRPVATTILETIGNPHPADAAKRMIFDINRKLLERGLRLMVTADGGFEIEPATPMSEDGNLIQRAGAELARTGWNEDEEIAMLNILRMFFEQWDSGGAVSVAALVLARLISGQPLEPLTGAEDEWFDPMGDMIMLQNKRCSTVFKAWRMPDGKLSDEPGHGRQECNDIENPAWDGTFPYMPPTRLPADPIMVVGTSEHPPELRDAERVPDTSPTYFSGAGGAGAMKA